MLPDKICELIDIYINEDGSKVNYNFVGYEAAKWALIVRAFDWLQWSANTVNNTSVEYSSTYPTRPDDGAWILTGYETIDWKKPEFVGQHGYISHDKNEVKKDIDYGQFKFYYKYICDKTPEHLSWKEAYTLWLVCSGRIEECEKSYLDKLLEYGYLKKDGSIREAWGTTNAALAHKYTNGRGCSRELYATTAYFDIEKSAWRSFRWEQIVQVL